MRVKVSHSIELADVPHKIGEMIEQVQKDLVRQAATLSAAKELCADATYMPTVAVMLDKIRKKLESSDSLASEAQSMASGLVDYYSDRQEEQSAKGDIDEMEEVLTKMGEQINAAQQELDVHEG